MAHLHLCAQGERSAGISDLCLDFAAHNFLQSMEELHQSGLGSPWLCAPGAGTDIAGSESLGLRLQIDLRVDIGSIERDVAQPATDRVDVDASAQQMRGRRVADNVRTDHLFDSEGALFAARLAYRFTSAWIPERVIGCPLRFRNTRSASPRPTAKARRDIERCWPQWTSTPFLAFSQDLRAVGVVVEVGERQSGCFADACAGVVEEEQHRVITLTLRRRALRSSQKSPHLSAIDRGK